ncbi:hypothetical protein ACVWU4_000950 [Campylobacter coli]
MKYLVLSDIHLGHNINKTELIVNNLRLYFKENYVIFSKLDYIFLAGDVFDKLLLSSGSDFMLANSWLVELVMFCKEHNIKLRILEGTPSHDWKQSEVVYSIISKYAKDLDYKYIKTLFIENDNGFYILYVPDEYKPNAKDTYKEVLKLLADNNIKKVDIAIMHGQFTYQLPGIDLPSSHNEEDYLNIVKHYISIGHIHKSTVNGRILAQGSFDRLAHNEEEDKGGMCIILDKDKGDSFSFIVNKHSMLFLTYKYDNIEEDELLKDIDKKIKKLPMYSNVRLILNSNLLINKSIKELNKKYPNIKLKIESKDKVNNNILNHVIKQEDIPIGLEITKDNIKDLLYKELEKYNFNNKDMGIINNILSNVI